MINIFKHDFVKISDLSIRIESVGDYMFDQTFNVESVHGEQVTISCIYNSLIRHIVFDTFLNSIVTIVPELEYDPDNEANYYALKERLIRLIKMKLNAENNLTNEF